MGKRRFRTGTLLLLLLAAPWGGRSGAEVKAAPSAQEGWVFIDEGLSSALVDEPAHHFHGAREALAKGDPETAALEIRKAAAYIRIEASRAVPGAKPALDAAVAELEGLAKTLGRGQAVPAFALDEAFARAHQSLAQHHYLKAAQFRSEGRTEKVWHDLQAATVHLEGGLEWAGQEIAAGARRAAEEARQLGERARGGARWTEDEVGRAVEALGLEIEKLGKQIRQAPR
jgi:hypothetical protein